jgi:hypothetical protein
MRREEEAGEPTRPGSWDAEEAPLPQRTPRAGGSGGGAGDDPSTLRRDPGQVRAEDTEPYIGLQYVARLFKIVAMIVLVAIIAEVVAGFMYEGAGAAFNLFAEVIQGGVLSAMLWGAGDLTLLFIDVGHDVRAARVLLGRMSTRMNQPDMGNMRRREGRDGRPGDEPL